jgi:hypothetical protein
MTDPATLASWRKAFEMVGPETLRLELARNNYEPEYRRAAIEWLLKQDAKAAAIERGRFWAMLLWTIIAAVAAVIAAWPVVQGWIR